MQIEFRGTVLELEFSSYANNDRLFIGGIDAETGEPYMDITVNMPHILLRDDEIIIKDYSENEGIFQALKDADIVGPKLFPARSGYVEATVCRLLINPEEYNKKEYEIDQFN